MKFVGLLLVNIVIFLMKKNKKCALVGQEVYNWGVVIHCIRNSKPPIMYKASLVAKALDITEKELSQKVNAVQ